MTANETTPTNRYAKRQPADWIMKLRTCEKMAADMLENAMTIPYTKPRRLMNQFPMKEADGSTKMHDPAAPTKNPETCHCQISWKRLIDATAPDRTTMATDMTIRVSYFESSLPARGVTSVVPMK